MTWLEEWPPGPGVIVGCQLAWLGESCSQQKIFSLVVGGTLRVVKGLAVHWERQLRGRVGSVWLGGNLRAGRGTESHY